MNIQQQPAIADLLRNALPLHILQNILTCYADLPCFLIIKGAWRTWYPLVSARPKPSAIDFENQAQWEARMRYNDRALQTVCREKRALCLPHQGVYGLFVPLLWRDHCLGVLQCGEFLREIPTEAALERQWRKLAGRAPRPNDQEFLEYARALAQTPVMNASLVKGLQELLEITAAVLTRSAAEKEAAQKMRALQIKVFARQLCHRRWLASQVTGRKFFRYTPTPRKLLAWEMDELGLRRFPTTVLAAKPEGSGREWADCLAAMLFYQRARKVGAQVPETLVFPLDYYGALLLCSAPPGLSSQRSRQQLKVQAEKFASLLSASLGRRLWVGVGSTGQGLHQSYPEAVAALHVAQASNQAVVFFEDIKESPSRSSSLRQKTAALVSAAVEKGPAQATNLRPGFVQEVLVETRGRPEASRRAFLAVLHGLLETLEKRKSLPAQDLAPVERETTLPLESAVNLNDMVSRFEEAFNLLVSFLERPSMGDKYLRLRRVQEALLEAPQEAWTLPQAARRFGFSPTAFSREFVRFVGLPFSQYLLNQRLEKAKRLLASGSLPLGLVAEACGFASDNYFSQVFKQKTGETPGNYRRRHQHKNE